MSPMQRASGAHLKGDAMKKTTKALKLKLNRDTLRLLENRELSLAEGQGTKNTLTACDGYANSGCLHTCLC
jgi:hypothetical protein